MVMVPIEVNCLPAELAAKSAEMLRGEVAVVETPTAALRYTEATRMTPNKLTIATGLRQLMAVASSKVKRLVKFFCIKLGLKG